MNCHIGSTIDGFEDVMKCFNFGVRNHEREKMPRLCQEHNLRVTNSYYQKKWDHLIIIIQEWRFESQINYVVYNTWQTENEELQGDTGRDVRERAIE